MELWYSEDHTDYAKFSIKVKQQLESTKSDFQDIAVFDSYDFGKILVLDGYLMLTERDEFVYHEMITHVAMAVNPKIKDVLVIGAGDGGTIRELARYDHIERIDMVEIDRIVVEVCKKHIPQTACCFDDKRVNLFFEDGVKYVRRVVNEYDLIIVDSTDPFGPGETLFTKEFYGNCYKALKEDGILVNQHESPYYEEDREAMQRSHKLIKSIFPISKVYQAHIPTYPSGHWCFGFASRGLDPIKDLKAEEWKKFNLETKYYNTDLHVGAFYLPTYVKELLEKC